MALKMRMSSSMEKWFITDPIESKKEKTEFTMFKNERLSFQVAFRMHEEKTFVLQYNCPVVVGGSLAKYATVRQVGNIMNLNPTYNVNPGGEFITTTPGVYPDVIRSLPYPNATYLPHEQTHALWVDIQLDDTVSAGEYDISIAIHNDSNQELNKVEGKVTVLDALLPKQKLIHTEWFYTDSIANAYNVKAFSKKHWEYIEKFLRVATKNGINMILTPIITPELDTYIGGERLTTQLVDIELVGKDKYKFGFEKLHKWIDLCLDCGVEYFEMPAFFTQWGAAAAPKIIVKVNGKNKKYFGWHTDSMGKEYKAFLDQFIPAIIGEFKSRNLDKKCFFHVSDEPNLNTLEQYNRCKKLLDEYLDGYPIIDALSDFEFYSTVGLKKPVPHTRGAQPFIDAKIDGLWVYYCGGGKGGVSDRSVAMPSQRTRILGTQLYYFNIEGFLHWGYNYYNNKNSYGPINPFATPDCEGFTPVGDSFLVYPAPNGEVWESLRLNALREGMDDMRALSLYESKFGFEQTKRLIEEGAGEKFDFITYPKDAQYIENLREKIYSAFKD